MPEQHIDTRATHDWRRDAMRLAAERDAEREDNAALLAGIQRVASALSLEPTSRAEQIVDAIRARQASAARAVERIWEHLDEPLTVDLASRVDALLGHPIEDVNTTLVQPYGPKTDPKTEEAAPETEAASDRITSRDLTGALLGIRTPDPFLTMVRGVNRPADGRSDGSAKAPTVAVVIGPVATPNRPGRQSAVGPERTQNGPRFALDLAVGVTALRCAPCTLGRLRDEVGRQVPVREFAAAVDRLHAAGDLLLTLTAGQAIQVDVPTDDAPEADDAA